MKFTKETRMTWKGTLWKQLQRKLYHTHFIKNGLLSTISSLYFHWLAIVVSLYHTAYHSYVPSFRIAINYVCSIWLQELSTISKRLCVYLVMH